MGRYCFVSLSKTLDDVGHLKDAIEKTLHSANIPIKSYTALQPGEVLSQSISKMVTDAALAIFDISDAGAWVFYEVGIAQGARVPVILIGNRGASVPSDFAHRLILYYDTTSEFDMNAFQAQLRDAVMSYWTAELSPELTNSQPSEIDISEVFEWLSKALKEQNYKEAESTLNALLNSNQAAHDSKLRAEVLHQLGLVAQARGENTLALRYLQQEVDLVQEDGKPERLLSVYANLGNVLADTGDLDRAQKFYGDALRLSESLDDETTLATVRSNLGNLLVRQGNFDQAEQLFQSAAVSFRETENPAYLARTLVNLAAVAEKRGEFDEAATVFEEALEFFERIGDRHSSSGVMNNLASIKIEQGANEEASRLLERSLRIKQEIGDVRGVANVLQNLASLNYGRGRFSEATDQLREVIDIRQRLNDRFGLLNAVSLLSKMLLQTGRLEEAESLTREAELIAASVGSKTPSMDRSSTGFAHDG